MMRTAISPRLATKSFCMAQAPHLVIQALFQREGGTLSWAPSAVTDAGNGAPLSWHPSADAVAGRGKKVLHAKNAVAGRCQRLLHGHGNGQAQDTPRLQGV